MQSLKMLEPALDAEFTVKTGEDGGDIGNVALQL